MKTLTRGVLVLAGTAALAATTGMAGCDVNFFASRQHDTRSYEVPGSFTALRVEGDGGKVEVVGTGTDTVKVRERRSWTSDRNKPETTRTTENGTLRLEIRCGHQVIGFDGCGISYRIEVPAKTMADLHTDSGGLTVSGLTGDSLRLSADSGSIHATRVRTGRLEIDNDSGKIEVTGEASWVQLSNDSGMIDSDGLRADRLTVRGHSGKIELDLLKAPESLDVGNDSGSVKVLLPGDQSYDFTLDSGSAGGHIAPALRRDSSSEHKIRVSTDSGRIVIDSLSERDRRPAVPERPEQPQQPERPEQPEQPGS